jgi:hypothetical protein
VDKENGIRRFVVGTGGNGCCRAAARVHPALRRKYGKVLGYLELSLGRGKYSWNFVAIEDQPTEDFNDSGHAKCH